MGMQSRFIFRIRRIPLHLLWFAWLLFCNRERCILRWTRRRWHLTYQLVDCILSPGQLWRMRLKGFMSGSYSKKED